MLCCRLLTCKVESCMIKLNVSYVENESYQVKLNVVFVIVGCRKVKLKVVCCFAKLIFGGDGTPYSCTRRKVFAIKINCDYLSKSCVA